MAISALGSRIDRSRAAGFGAWANAPRPRAAPMALRFGPLVPPAPSARWQPMQPPLPVKIALPFAGLPGITPEGVAAPPARAAPGATPTIERRNATVLIACSVVRGVGGIAVPWIPV